MARLPELRRILRENVSEAPQWIERIIVPINLALEQIYSALNRNLDYDNIIGTVFETQLNTPAGYATGDFNTFAFTWPHKVTAREVRIGQVLEVTDTPGVYVTLSNPITVSAWLQLTANQITVQYITGLDNNKTYNIRLVAQ